MNTLGIIQAVAKQKVQQIISSSVMPWIPTLQFGHLSKELHWKLQHQSTNSEAFKAQIWKLLIKHVFLILQAVNIILLHKRPSVRIMRSSVRIMHIIHSMHTLAYICCKILTFHLLIHDFINNRRTNKDSQRQHRGNKKDKILKDLPQLDLQEPVLQGSLKYTTDSDVNAQAKSKHRVFQELL